MNPERIRVLFTAAGRRVELLRCFRRDAAELGLDLEIHAGDMAPDLSSACAQADKTVSLLPSFAPEYATTVLQYCKDHGVQLLVPMIDGDLLPLARQAESFRAAGVLLNLPDLSAVRVCRDKMLTAQTLLRGGITTPRSTRLEELDSLEGWTPPLLFKPVSGSASKGVMIAQSIADATRLCNSIDGNYMLQECITGPEYTINCFYDQLGQLRCAVPHQRVEVRAGEVSKGRTERNQLLIRAAQEMGRALPGLFGCVCFQAVLTEKGPVVFEINGRFGGGYPLAYEAGAHFPRWLMQLALGREPDYSDEWKDGLLMLRYDAAVFTTGSLLAEEY